jgi:hypothetical protein
VKIFFLTLLNIGFAVFPSAAQNSIIIDSLNNILITAKEDTAKVNTLYTLARQYKKY